MGISPFGAPMAPPPVPATAPPPVVGPPPISQADPSLNVMMDPTMILRMLFEEEPEFKPKYPRGYKKKDYPKPKTEDIWAHARKEESRQSERVQMMMDTIRRLRFDVSGIFPRDQAARDLGDQDPFVSSALVDDWQLLSSILASFDMGYVKSILNQRNQLSGQTLEDWAKYMREEEIYRWANTGDMPLPIAEAKVLTSYGQIISRHLCDMDDPDYPFSDTLCDPASCYPVYGGTTGLKKMYRVLKMNRATAYAEWGEPSKEDRAKIVDAYGTEDDNRMITVVEYADKRWRAAVTEGGVALLPPTEHDDGEVPFIVQGGVGGEPLCTYTARANMRDDKRDGHAWWQSGPDEDWGLKNKLVSSIHLQKARHDQLEALMARITTSIGNSENPALIVTRDNLSFGTKLPKISRKPGAVNEIGMGESVSAVPTAPSPFDFNAFMTQVNADKMTGSIPLGMYGNQTGSQQTGNSMSVAAEQGMDHISPWVLSLETYHTRKVEMKNRIWRNKGHLTRFIDGEEKRFMVPVSKPTSAQEMARELTPQLIDEIGPRVKVSMTRIRVQELMQLANIGGALIPNGLMSRQRLAEKMGIYDYNRMREEWMEEAEWEMLNNDEEMRRMVKLPMKIRQWMEQAQSEEERAMYMTMLDLFMEKQMAAAQPQPQPGMPPQGGPPMAGAPMGGPAMDNTMNYAALGAPPGANGGQVGRPALPFGPMG